MKIRYLLKKRGKRGGFNPIYIALYGGDSTELIFTKEKISNKDWSDKERIPKDHTGDTFARIEKVKNLVQKSMKLLEAQDKAITPFAVKQYYLTSQKTKSIDQAQFEKKEKENHKSILSMADRWLLNNTFQYRASTRKTIKESIYQFKEFLKLNRYAKIERKDLTPEVINDYERFLQDKKRLANSTHGKRMKHLKWFLKSIKFDVSDIKIRTHRKEIIALTLDELGLLEEVDVSTSSELQKAKDLFLLGCYTGLRISDLKRLNETRLIDGKIRMTLQKNDKEVLIPIRKKTGRILETYSMAAPKISEQHLNSGIKIVCKLAGIDRILSVKSNVAGQDVESKLYKYQLITSHTASKTFITLAPQLFKMTPEEIAAIVGKDLKTLLNHYFKLPQESAIQKMMEV